MLISLFTPTHNTQFLDRLARSVARQTCAEFEWVIVPNGDAGEVRVDLPQARIVPYAGQTQNIGELKRFACLACRGDVLVEVDHDDELTPDCVAELAAAFADQRVDFAYSNCCEINDGKPWRYDERFGWRYRPFTWDGQPQWECVAFDPTPASFSKIWFAPNHVRAWRADFYRRIGGHDPARAVLDDQDILCRTFIHGRLKHIDRCLYVYHVHAGNTCRGEQNGFIQTETLALHDRYIYPLVERWCDQNGLRKIDLCGGINPAHGYESVDLHGGRIAADLNAGWPFGNGEVGVFRAHDALEHLRDPIHTMKELHRCLAPQGWLLSQTPSTDGRGAFQDPTHVSFWNSNSFWYYTRADQNRFIDCPVRFQANRLKNFFPSEWHREHQIVYVKADLLKGPGESRVAWRFEDEMIAGSWGTSSSRLQLSTFRGSNRVYSSTVLIRMGTNSQDVETPMDHRDPIPYSESVEVLPSDEADDISRVVQSLKALLQRNRDKTGHFHGDVHVKTHGCAAAEFRVLPNLPPELAQGLFKNECTFSAVVRFSNSASQPQADLIPDGRGLAIKVFDVEGDRLTSDDNSGRTQDFVMVNHPVFFARNAKDFLRLEKVLVSADDNPLVTVAEGLTGGDWNPLNWHWREALTAAQIAGHLPAHPASNTYFSMAPIRFGQYVAKYRARPAGDLPGTWLDLVSRLGTQPDALRLMLAETLRSQQVLFEFQIQLRTSANSMPVEDATVEWPESESPYRTVALLLMPRQEIDTEQQKAMCRQLAFNVWHAITDHRPLGGINRLRREVYPISAAWRRQEGGAPPQETA